jgi:hypothetical protein
MVHKRQCNQTNKQIKDLFLKFASSTFIFSSYKALRFRDMVPLLRWNIVFLEN